MGQKTYVERDYRSLFSKERWYGFAIRDRESDLWIGISRNAFSEALPAVAERVLREVRAPLEAYILRDPAFVKALVPYTPLSKAPEIVLAMAAAASRAGIGPMSAVAGAVAERVGKVLKTLFGADEIIVENGGDIYADLTSDLDVSVFAGESPLSERVGLHISMKDSPLGICTSSGTVGPSLSFGKADAVMIVAKDVPLSDSWATAFANSVQTESDLDACVNRISQIPEILGAIVIKGERLAVAGHCELRLFEK